MTSGVHAVKLLIDTHTLLWAVDDPAKLGRNAAVELRNFGNGLLLGAGTQWELSIKVGLRKLGLSLPFRDWTRQAITDLGLTILPITVDSADAQSQLPRHHGESIQKLAQGGILHPVMPGLIG